MHIFRLAAVSRLTIDSSGPYFDPFDPREYR